MKDLEAKYTRYDVCDLKVIYKRVLLTISEAKRVEDILDGRKLFIMEINKFFTCSSLSYFLSLTGKDKKFFYSEVEYYNNAMPQINAMKRSVVLAIMESPLYKEVKNHLNREILRSYEILTKIDYDKITDLIKNETELIKEYHGWVEKFRIEYCGEKVSFRSIKKILSETTKTEERYYILDKINEALDNGQDAAENIVLKLIDVRRQMAKECGFDSFTQFSFVRSGRIDFTEEDMIRFENQIADMVPEFMCLLKAIGRVSLLKTSVGLFDKVEKVLYKLSNRAGNLFREMRGKNLLVADPDNIISLPSFCTSFYNYKTSAVILRLNGGFRDVKSVFHEFGHCFSNSFMFKKDDPEFGIGGEQLQEAQAMIMEIFGASFADDFFKEKGNDYIRMFFLDFINSLLYNVALIDFQQTIYEKDVDSLGELNRIYEGLEIKYRPYIERGSLFKGRLWLFSTILFDSPFNNFDYAVARLTALGFAEKIFKNRKEAFKIYETILENSKGLSFENLLAETGQASVFDKCSIIGIIETIKAICNKTD